jgi:hypothetical protein
MRHNAIFQVGNAVDRPTEPILEPLKPVAAGLELACVQGRKRARGTRLAAIGRLVRLLPSVRLP